MIAARNGHEKVVHRLLDHENVRIDMLNGKWSALAYAAYNGSEAIVALILKRSPAGICHAILVADIRGNEAIMQMLEDYNIAKEEVESCLAQQKKRKYNVDVTEDLLIAVYISPWS